jgi:hypothetical protein
MSWEAFVGKSAKVADAVDDAGDQAAPGDPPPEPAPARTPARTPTPAPTSTPTGLSFEEFAKRAQQADPIRDMPSSPTALSDIFKSVARTARAEIDPTDFDLFTEAGRSAYFDEAGRPTEDHDLSVSTGKYRAPFITGKELYGGRKGDLSPDAAERRVLEAVTTAVQDRQNIEEKLERLEEVQADPNEIRQAQVELRQAKEVHTQLVRIRDQMLPRRQKLVDLYKDMGGDMIGLEPKIYETPEEIIARQIKKTQLAAINEESDAGRTGRRVSGVDPSKPTDEQFARRAKLAEYDKFGADTTIKGPGI